MEIDRKLDQSAREKEKANRILEGAEQFSDAARNWTLSVERLTGTGEIERFISDSVGDWR